MLSEILAQQSPSKSTDPDLFTLVELVNKTRHEGKKIKPDNEEARWLLFYVQEFISKGYLHHTKLIDDAEWKHDEKMLHKAINDSRKKLGLELDTTNKFIDEQAKRLKELIKLPLDAQRDLLINDILPAPYKFTLQTLTDSSPNMPGRKSSESQSSTSSARSQPINIENPGRYYKRPVIDSATPIPSKDPSSPKDATEKSNSREK